MSRPDITLAGLIERFEADYLSQYGASALPSQLHALASMKRCRTQLASHMLAQCGACGEQRLVPHSCGHRSCPHCQANERTTGRSLVLSPPSGHKR